MRQMHINDIAHSWWKAPLLADQSLRANGYYSVMHWFNKQRSLPGETAPQLTLVGLLGPTAGTSSVGADPKNCLVWPEAGTAGTPVTLEDRGLNPTPDSTNTSGAES